MSINQEIAADAAEIFTAFGKEMRLGGQVLPSLISERQETVEFMLPDPAQPGLLYREGRGELTRSRKDAAAVACLEEPVR